MTDPDEYPYFPFSPQDPYWADAPVVSLEHGRLTLISGELAGAHTTLAALAELAGEINAGGADEVQLGVLGNPLGGLALIKVGEYPEEDTRYFHTIDTSKVATVADVDEALDAAEQIQQQLRRAKEHGWVVFGTDETRLWLCTPQHLEFIRTYNDVNH